MDFVWFRDENSVNDAGEIFLLLKLVNQTNNEISMECHIGNITNENKKPYMDNNNIDP